MMDIKDYSEKYSDHYSGNFKFEPVLIKYRRQRVLDAYNKHSHKRVLEIGCGMEPFFKFVNDFDEFVIVEPSEEFVNNAIKLASNDNRIKIFQGFFEDKIDEIRGTRAFDFIIFSSLIHEVGNPDDFLTKIHSLCNENTVVHINVPNMFGFHRLLALEMGLIKSIYEKSSLDKKFQRTGNFDMKSLCLTAERSGFEVIEKGTYFIKPFTNNQFEEIIKFKIADENIFNGLDKMVKYMPDLGAEMFINVRIRK